MLVRNPVAPAAFDSLATQPNKGIVSVRRLRIAERMGRNLEVDDDRPRNPTVPIVLGTREASC